MNRATLWYHATANTRAAAAAHLYGVSGRAYLVGEEDEAGHRDETEADDGAAHAPSDPLQIVGLSLVAHSHVP